MMHADQSSITCICCTNQTWGGNNGARSRLRWWVPSLYYKAIMPWAKSWCHTRVFAGGLSVGTSDFPVAYTPSVPNYRSFDFFDHKFDYWSSSKICAKYHFFLLWIALSIQVLQEWVKFDYVFTNFLNKTSYQTWCQKSQTLIIWNGESS